MHEMTTEEVLDLPVGFEPAFMGDVKEGDIIILKRFVSNQKYGEDYFSGDRVLMYAVDRRIQGDQYKDEQDGHSNRVDNFILYDDMDLPCHWSCSWIYPCFIYRGAV